MLKDRGLAGMVRELLFGRPGAPPEDIDLTHRLWLRLMDCGLGPKLHHRDVLGLALRRLETELAEGGSQSIVDELKHDVEFRSSLPEAGSPEE